MSDTTCELCGIEGALTSKVCECYFEYGEAKLTYQATVYSCSSCEAKYTDMEAEAERLEATVKYLQVQLAEAREANSFAPQEKDSLIFVYKIKTGATDEPIESQKAAMRKALERWLDTI